MDNFHDSQFWSRIVTPSPCEIGYRIERKINLGEIKQNCYKIPKVPCLKKLNKTKIKIIWNNKLVKLQISFLLIFYLKIYGGSYGEEGSKEIIIVERNHTIQTITAWLELRNNNWFQISSAKHKWETPYTNVPKTVYALHWWKCRRMSRQSHGIFRKHKVDK